MISGGKQNEKTYFGVCLGLGTGIITNPGVYDNGERDDPYRHQHVDTITFNIPTTDPGYNTANGTWTIKLTEQVVIRDKMSVTRFWKMKRQAD